MGTQTTYPNDTAAQKWREAYAPSGVYRHPWPRPPTAADFRGAWDRLRGAHCDLVIPTEKNWPGKWLDFRWHGYWGGPGVSDGKFMLPGARIDWNGKTQDDLDKAFRTHDMQYALAEDAYRASPKTSVDREAYWLSIRAADAQVRDKISELQASGVLGGKFDPLYIKGDLSKAAFHAKDVYTATALKYDFDPDLDNAKDFRVRLCYQDGQDKQVSPWAYESAKAVHVPADGKSLTVGDCTAGPVAELVAKIVEKLPIVPLGFAAAGLKVAGMVNTCTRPSAQADAATVADQPAPATPATPAVPVSRGLRMSTDELRRKLADDLKLKVAAAQAGDIVPIPRPAATAGSVPYLQPRPPVAGSQPVPPFKTTPVPAPALSSPAPGMRPVLPTLPVAFTERFRDLLTKPGNRASCTPETPMPAAQPVSAGRVAPAAAARPSLPAIPSMAASPVPFSLPAFRPNSPPSWFSLQPAPAPRYDYFKAPSVPLFTVDGPRAVQAAGSFNPPAAGGMCRRDDANSWRVSAGALN